MRAIVEVGGEYPDVVQALQQAKRDGALVGRLSVDSLPRAGRVYDPDDAESEGADGSPESDDSLPADAPYRVATPLPDLFSSQR